MSACSPYSTYVLRATPRLSLSVSDAVRSATCPHHSIRLDLCTQGLEAMHDVLIPTVDAVDIAERGAALRAEHRDEDDGRRAKCGRADDLGRFEPCRALYRDAVRVEEAGRRAEAIELGVVDSALLVDPVVDECHAFGLCGYDGEEGKVVDVETRVRTSVNLFRECDELGRLYGNVSKLRDAVFGNAFI